MHKSLQGTVITIFFLGSTFGWDVQFMQREKSEDTENKDKLRSVCIGSRDTSPGILFFNMQAKQGQSNTGKLEVMKNTEQCNEIMKKNQKEQKCERTFK